MKTRAAALTLGVICVCAGLLGSKAASAQRTYSAEEEHNKQVVLEFYDDALNKKDFDAAKQFLGTYKQHNPNAADGPAGLRAFLEHLKQTAPESHNEITQTLVDGDFVVLRVHSRPKPGAAGNAIVDIFRLKDGKIEEHWDSVQPVPDTSSNTNTMF